MADYTELNNPYNSFLARENVDAISLGTVSAASGEGDQAVNSSEKTISGTEVGDLWIDTFIKSRDYKPGSTGFYLDGKTGNAEFANIVLTGGGLSYGKISFSDSTNAGYYIGENGIYFGSASDTTYLKYDISAATLTLYGMAIDGGTIAGQSTANVGYVATTAADSVPTDLAYSTGGISTGADGSQSAYVVLTWTALVSNTLDHYCIRYKKSALTYYTYLTANTNTITIDGLTPNISYDFGVASVNKYGTSSAFSADITQTTAMDTTAPATVTAGSATAGIQYVIVEWTKNSESDLSYYNIYRNESNDTGTATLIGSTKTNYFIDGGRVGGTTYYYWVKAVDTSGNVSTSFSTVKSATPRNVESDDVVSLAGSKVLIDGVVYLSDWRKGGDLTKIDGGQISANSITTTQLNFTPVQDGNIIASINASVEGITIDADNISIGGTTTFASGYDPTSKASTFAQNGIPTSSAIGDIWIDTDDNNKMYRAAMIGADEIKAGEWELVVISGVKTFAQDAIPTAVNAGDIWIDTNDSNKMYRSTNAGDDEVKAGEWTLTSIQAGTITGQGALATKDTISTSECDTTIIDGGKIVTGLLTADNIQAGSLSANYIGSGTITSKTITLAVSAGTGDTYIAAGKTDFTNDANGFILGIDDSDDDKAKFYIGDSYNYLNWNGEKLSISGYEIYDAVVDPRGYGNYVDINSAIQDGKRNIYLKKGLHILYENTDIQQPTLFTGENKNTTIITRTITDKEYAASESSGRYYLGSYDTNWTVTNTSGTTYRYTWLGGGEDPHIDLIRRGDYIYIDGASNFNANNQGSFLATTVGTNYFEVTNASGTAESNIKEGIYDNNPTIILYRNALGTDTTAYSITNTAGTTYRYTWNGSGSSPYIEERFNVGDFLYINKSSSSFNIGNRGFYQITAIGTNYLEVTNASGVVESDKTLIGYDMVVYGFLGGSTTQFDITSSSGNYMRYTWDGTGTDPEIATKLIVGVEIKINAQNFSAANNGNFIVSRTGTNWFEIYNAAGVIESNKTIGTGYIRRHSDILGDSRTTIAVTNPAGTTWRYTYSSGLDPKFADNVAVGDEIYIESSSGFAANNEGRMVVTAVDVTYFEVSKAAGTAETVEIDRGMMRCNKSISLRNYSNTMDISNVTIKNLANSAGSVYTPTTLLDCIFDEVYRGNGYIIKYPDHIERCYIEISYSSAYLYGVYLWYDDDVKIINNIFDTVWGANIIYTVFGTKYGDSTTQFDVTNTAGSTYRYTYDGTGTNPSINSTWKGYYVKITGTNMASANEGIFLVTAADTNYFEVTNDIGTAESNKTINTGSLRRLSFSSISHNLVISNNRFYGANASSGVTNLVTLICLSSIITGNNFELSSADLSDKTFLNISGQGNTISNNNFSGSGNHILIEDLGKTVVTSNYFYNYGAYGVNYNAVANNNDEGYTIISNNVFDAVAGTGTGVVVATTSSGIYQKLSITGNTCDGGTHFIDADELTSAVISNNVAANTSDCAFYVNGSQYTVISGNVSDTCLQGFDLNNLDYCTIYGNVSRNNTNADGQTSITNSENAHNIFKT